ncbi:MAG: hypothetical protein QXX68_00280 [Candidatus Pacearchaeota archaeon]
MKKRKKITKKKGKDWAEIRKKDEETIEKNKQEEKKDELPEEESQKELSLEFIPIEETKKQQPKKISLEDELFFQEEQNFGLNSLASSFLGEEEKRKKEENPYSFQKENPYSTRKDERKYSVSAHPRLPNIGREHIEIRLVDLSSPLSTLTTAQIKGNFTPIRMPEEEMYKQEPYKRYELEIVSPDDLSRKTKEHREVKIKYDID